MNVARYKYRRYRARFLLSEFQEGDFDHAVDNFGDSAGLVADWLALERWWRPHPLAARSRRGYFDHQPGNRPASRLA